MSRDSVNEPEVNNDILLAIKLERQRSFRTVKAIDVDVDLGLEIMQMKILGRKRSADNLVLKPAASNFIDGRADDSDVGPRKGNCGRGDAMGVQSDLQQQNQMHQNRNRTF